MEDDALPPVLAEGESASPGSDPSTRSGLRAARDLKTWAASSLEDRAATKLAALAPGHTVGTVATPFPHPIDRHEYKWSVMGTGIWQRVEKTKPTRVPLDQLSAFQRTVNAEKVAQYVADPHLVPEGKRGTGHGGLIDYPVVVKVGGKMFVHDGNHRAAAAKLRGEKDILARVIDLDGDKEGTK